MKPLDFRRFVAATLLLAGGAAAAATPVDLKGYGDGAGPITVLNGGDSSDPYFALQALLLAHDNGLDIAEPGLRFARWLVPWQKPDGTFDRFCRSKAGPWVACQAADADDALLALWLRLLEALPQAAVQATPALVKSHSVSQAALDHLYQPSRGVYMVSPLVLHGLFIDNLEVWSLRNRPGLRTSEGANPGLARSIHQTFWDPVNRRFLVSTQLEHRAEPQAFYPHHVAQVFPLLVGFPLLPADARSHYREWMRAHRAEWLRQGKADYPWGLLAVLALQQNDTASARCWLRETAGMRHSARWAVTDEVSYQIVTSRGLRPASANSSCA